MSVLLIPGQRVHIVGISGYGMSAIARILVESGYTVSGSDVQMNALTEALRRDGVVLYHGHDSGQVMGAEVVLASSAIPDDNIELQAARGFNIPVLRRREAIGLITQGHRTIAIAGTHGKTTTTALMTHLLIEAGLEPSYIVGGVMKNTGTNAGVGRGKWFVIEADEYQEMFLGLTPAVAVVANVEYDHPDVFPSLDAVIAAFRQFVACLPDDGLLVACADDPASAELAQERLARGLPVLTYGVDTATANWSASNLQPRSDGGMDFVVRQSGGIIGKCSVPLAGSHNVQNALATIAVARHLGVPFAMLAQALPRFTGTGRRSEVMGKAAGVTVVSDYAHHPTAIRVTLEAWAVRPEAQRLWAVWQPHTYTRLRALAADFARSFGRADQVLVTDVYSVREVATPGLAPPDLVEMIHAAGQSQARYSGNLEQTADLLAQEVRSGDTVVILSAGDAPRIGSLLLKALAQNG